eukprot:TRINITY_DN1590_c0_g1_i3.p1 TRINITY_DN1590_c0_g1~~TRINITY_DN1590_c0_g1_i3.p1  ORF type:complete len:156 (-),score=14.01 TRINITY_DN1590_c0_g1_i3:28-495(-)
MSEILYHCEDLEIINCDGVSLTDKSIEMMIGNPRSSRNKITLNFRRCVYITDKTVDMISAHCCNLRTLVLGGDGSYSGKYVFTTDAIVRLIQQLKNTIHYLNLEHVNVDSKLLDAISLNVPYLKKLCVAGTKITQHDVADFNLNNPSVIVRLTEQ